MGEIILWLVCSLLENVYGLELWKCGFKMLIR